MRRQRSPCWRAERSSAGDGIAAPVTGQASCRSRWACTHPSPRRRRLRVWVPMPGRTKLRLVGLDQGVGRRHRRTATPRALRFVGDAAGAATAGRQSARVWRQRGWPGLHLARPPTGTGVRRGSRGFGLAFRAGAAPLGLVPSSSARMLHQGCARSLRIGRSVSGGSAAAFSR